MIYYLKGKIAEKENSFLVVDVGGVGYKVSISYEEKKKIGQNILLYCFMQKTEKDIRLFGFKDKENLELFEKLTKISGIGPKTALQVASIASIKELKEGIEKEDSEVMKKIFSIGKKKGQQVVFELSRKIIKENKEDEAFLVLKNLGFCEKKISEALKKVPKGKNEEERVEEALKILGSK